MYKNKIFYLELRQKAILEGIDDNKVSIGLWIKINGYTRHHHTDKNNKSFYFYTKENE